MLQRTAVVQNCHVINLTISSVLEVGDSQAIECYSRALAVQREYNFFYGYEGHFQYPIFSEYIHLPPIEEKITFLHENFNPVIKVNNIDVIGISTSSLLHIGNSKHIFLESRNKHIRQLRERKENGDRKPEVRVQRSDLEDA
ncbi:spore germination protein GerPE [Bacillaceae bacterium Marseille-Q3522]|nr:spore germination protein GerPE [Bacillaceae bacterium Marseille-Q3522]